MKAAKRPAPGDALTPRALPDMSDCLYHRCDRHERVPALNQAEEQTGSECGACIAEGAIAVRAQLLLALDGYAERLEFAHSLRLLLAGARDRLNLLSPGAGDYLKEGDVG